MLSHPPSHPFFLTRTSLGGSRVGRGIPSVNHVVTAERCPQPGRAVLPRIHPRLLSTSRVQTTLYLTPGKAHPSRRKLMPVPNLVPRPHPVHLLTPSLPIPSVFHLRRDNVVLISIPFFLLLLLVDVPICCCVPVFLSAIVRVAVPPISMSFVSVLLLSVV